MLRGESILVLAPHPDDEVIGCGGFLALARREGRAISVLVATDGVAAEETDNSEEYRDQREQESREGLAVLGVDDVHFLRLGDRELARSLPRLVEAIAAKIEELNPDLILAPAPFDIHPDHHMVSRAVWEVFQDAARARARRDVTIAFYETSQPLLPSSIVDITEVAETKFDAIRAHASQMKVRDYVWFARGLAQFRALTMPPEVKYAEGYRQMTVRELGVQPWSRFVESMRPAEPPAIEVRSEAIPVTVIVRTKNRPKLLRQALTSIGSSGYPCQVVVVNDGGESVDEIVRDVIEDAKLIAHETSMGRSEAANRGVREASSEFVTFLDDDDLHYAEHLPTLAAGWREDSTAVYSDAVSAFYSQDDEGSWRLRDSMRLYTHDFDHDLLLVDNFIPLTTLLMRRDDFLDLDGFNPRFDLFEDWEFLIRLSARGDFSHVPRVTCEIRHFEGNQSAVLGAPEGSVSFRQAKRDVWELHRDELTDDVLLNVYERQKRRNRSLDDRLMNETGRSRQLESDVRRLGREMQQVLVRTGEEHEKASAAAHEMGGRLQQSEKQLSESREVIQRASADISALQEQIRTLGKHIHGLEKEVADREKVLDERDQTLRAHFDEIRRLNATLDTIYGSRTWKLHLLSDKLRGK